MQIFSDFPTNWIEHRSCFKSDSEYVRIGPAKIVLNYVCVCPPCQDSHNQRGEGGGDHIIKPHRVTLWDGVDGSGLR